MTTREEKFYYISKHAYKQSSIKGFPLWKIMKCMEEGEIIPSGQYPNQERYVHNGICCVTEQKGNGMKKIITVYLDKIITPLRHDQIEAGVEIKRR